MRKLRPFNEVKLQWLSQLYQDHSLSPRAMQIAAYIVVAHYNHVAGKAWPSYGFLAKTLDIDKKTVQRSISELEVEWFEVTRGNGVGKSTEYVPSKQSHAKAQKLRQTQEKNKRDNIVHDVDIEGGQTCPKRGAKLSKRGWQKCPPNKETKKRKEKNTSSMTLPDEDHFNHPPAFVEKYSMFERSWNEMLQRNGCNELDQIFEEVKNQKGRTGYMLPTLWPPVGPEARQALLKEWSLIGDAAA